MKAPEFIKIESSKFYTENKMPIEKMKAGDELFVSFGKDRSRCISYIIQSIDWETIFKEPYWEEQEKTGKINGITLIRKKEQD